MEISADLTPDPELDAIDPRKMSRDGLAAFGHRKRPIMSVIRAKCVECCGGSWLETLHCTTSTCPLWAYRTGKNPFSERQGNAEALAASRTAHQ
jgi:hypothetical protein